VTPRERAEKISLPHGYVPDERDNIDVRKEIAAEIESAVEEATKYFRKNDAEYLGVAVLSAYEDAAKIAESNDTSCFECGTPGQVIAQAIRSRAREVTGLKGEKFRE